MEGRRQWLKKFLGGVFGAFGITSGAAALNRGLTDEEAKQIANYLKEDTFSNTCPSCNICNICHQGCHVRCHFSCGNYTPNSISESQLLLD